MNNIKEYGNFLKEERERQGLSLEQISKDTKITIKVLEGLEAMDKDILPSETYRVGMLKSYAKYLKIDQEKIMSMVEINKIQEKPVEFDLINLQEKKEQRLRMYLYIGIAVVVLSIITMFFISGLNKTISNSIQQRAQESERKKRETADNLDTIKGFYESNFTVDERFRLVSGDKTKILEIQSVDPIKILIGDEVYTPEINQPILIDFENDGVPEYLLLMRSVNVARKQMLLRFDPKTDDTDLNVLQYNKSENIEQDGDPIDIIQAITPAPIQIELIFSQYSHYKFESEQVVLGEGNAARTEKRNVSSEKPIRVYLSNSNFVQMTVNGKKVSIPQTGLPVVLYFTWQQENDQYKLRAIPLP